MIEFQKILLKNFLGVGNDPIEIDFQKTKSALVSGTNGSGKSSTIVDSLTYALFGKPYRNVSLSQLPNTINGKGLLVQLHFKVGGNQYVVRRGIKPKVFEIERNGELVKKDAAEKDYQAFLESTIIKCNYKTFTQIVILSSSTFIPFMQLTAADRRSIIEDLLDIQIFSAMNVIVKQKLIEVKQKLQDIDASRQVNSDKIAIHKQYLKEQQTDRTALIETNNQKIVGFKTRLDALSLEVDELSALLEKLSAKSVDTDELYDNSEKITTILSKATGQLDIIEEELEFFKENDACVKCHQVITQDHKKTITDDLTGKHSSTTAKIEATSTMKKTLMTKIAAANELMKTINSTSQQVNLKRTEIKMIGQSIETLNEDNARHSTVTIDNLQKINDDIIELSKANEATDERVNKLHSYLKVLNMVVVMLKDTGIKTAIVKKYIPKINQLINKYLTEMGFNVQFEINENFEETIKSAYREAFTYQSFSEGEKARIDIALVFAWREIAQMRNSINTNLLILDEVFDSSLDVDANNNLLNIIHGLKGTHVFVISHKGDGLYDKFDRQLVFKKVKNFTKIDG